MGKKIIFVCHGNICRSPMAEMIFRYVSAGEEFEISSAAVSYEEEGNGLYPQAAGVLRRHGIPVSAHRAHRISAAEARDCDLMLIMDASNERLLRGIVPSDCIEKVHYLMEFAGKGRASVSDPWYTRDFERAFADILAGCEGLLAWLKKV